jgi:cytochrome c553
MKKLTILSVVTASLLLIGCGQDKTAETKAESAKAQSHQTESVADKAAKAVEATKAVASAAASKATEAAKEAKKAVADKATKAVEATKEAAKEVKKAVSGNSAPAAYAKCAGCHGKDAKMKALGKSAVIAGQSKDDLIKKIKEYKAGTRNVAGMGALMKGQVAGLSDADIDAIATYVSGLK